MKRLVALTLTAFYQDEQPVRVMDCLSDDAGITAGAPQTATDLL
jgi:hypothetical protein